jgi:hypothetical protein
VPAAKVLLQLLESYIRLHFCLLRCACISGFRVAKQTFSDVAQLRSSGRNNFTKLLQLTVTPQPPLALVLVCHLCPFSVQSQRQKHLLTYALADRLKSFAFFM